MFWGFVWSHDIHFRLYFEIDLDDFICWREWLQKKLIFFAGYCTCIDLGHSNFKHFFNHFISCLESKYFLFQWELLLRPEVPRLQALERATPLVKTIVQPVDHFDNNSNTFLMVNYDFFFLRTGKSSMFFYLIIEF